jgi:alpha-mannosidase
LNYVPVLIHLRQIHAGRVGELYLEYHRGTLTTQAGIKRANRKNEIALHNLEWLTAIATMKGIAIRDDFWEIMRENWEDLLLMQFHDILRALNRLPSHDRM